ncbi:penicillin-binding protein activator LpoB [Entomomonas asaccharolytica]|uniref:Penicillin-binding protein activator LpoB n=1 Tax=Entomomonas asaccharolytica TaxID=2785331 RepID=A0A974NIJ1_9GAMM|nr:penicillin-binding protein activator LpoB [Entomomonas asaccharolytica]
MLTGLLVATLSLGAFAQEVKPKVAVTDLAYEEQVKDYIRVVDSTHNANTHSAGSYSNNTTSDYRNVEGTYTYVNQTELRKFVGDIKGDLKKSGLVDLIQGRPYSGDPDFDNINDIIARIDQGDFNGADYVLFGRVSDIQFSDNVMNIQHTNTYSKSLNLTVVAEFNLINTQTHEIKAAFTAMGEAKELKLVNSLDKKVTLDRAKLVSKVSKALGKDVTNQVVEQLTGKLPDDGYNPPVRHNVPADEPPTVIRRK